MEPWPFDNISPEDWVDLPDEDKAMIEALTMAFIAELNRQRTVDPDNYAWVGNRA